jgi:hypothetical protein
MSLKQKRIPKELREAVGREQATQIMNQVRALEAGDIDSFPVTVQDEKMEKARSAISKLSDKISVGDIYTITDYEDTGRNTFVVSRKEEVKEESEFRKPQGEALKALPRIITDYGETPGQPGEKGKEVEGLPGIITDYKEGTQVPLHKRLWEKIGASMSKTEMDGEMRKRLGATLNSMRPGLTEHAEKVQEGTPSRIPLVFDSPDEAKKAKEVLMKTGMLGEVSLKGDLLILEYSPQG